MSRLRPTCGGLVAALTAACIAAGPTTALAGPAASAPPAEPDNSPWRKGLIVPSFGFGAGFGPDIHVLNFGLGVGYFVIDGLAVGLSFTDTVLIYREAYKDDFPGIEDESPSNIVRLLPTLQYVFLRRFRFSPYVIAGVGPVFYNNGRGTVGEWLLGAGAYIGLARFIALNVGVDFTAAFPGDEWKEAFSYMGQSTRGCAIVDTPCSFNIAPRIGLVFAFGVGGDSKRKRKRKRDREQEEHEPVVVPMPEPKPQQPPPSVESEVPGSEAPTDAPADPPVDAPTDAPPTDAPPADAPPADAPPTDAPPTDAPPTDVTPPDPAPEPAPPPDAVTPPPPDGPAAAPAPGDPPPPPTGAN